MACQRLNPYAATLTECKEIAVKWRSRSEIILEDRLDIVQEVVVVLIRFYILYQASLNQSQKILERCVLLLGLALVDLIIKLNI
jgi:hypothetical protein